MNSRLYDACAQGASLLAWRHRRQAARFARLRDEYYRLFWKEAASQIGAELEDVGDGVVKIRKDDCWTFVRQGEAMVDSRLGLRMAGSKPLVLRLIKPLGIRTPRQIEFDFATIRRAHDYLLSLDGPLVVKPARGGAGRGVTTGIDTHARLRRASFAAAAYSWHLVAEEQVPGQSYRLLFLDGRLIDAVRRDPPTVVGDGVRNVRQLIAAENERRLGARPISALSPLTIDLDCQITLEKRGLTLGHVLPAGESIIVKNVSNQNSSREQHPVRDRVHPSLIELGVRAASALRLEFIGIDIVAPGVDVPLEESGGALIEINTAPGLHHHTLVSNPDAMVPVGALLLERQFARQAGRRTVSVNAAPERAARVESSHAEPDIAVRRVSPHTIERFALDVARASGAEGPQAELFAKILVWHDVMGRSLQGVWRLGPFCRRVSLGLIRCPCQPVFRQTGPATGVLDGDHGFGFYVGHLAMEHAIDLARDAGTGVVCVSGSNHFGSGAYYVQLAAERGMIGLAMSNAFPKVAAVGGSKPVFGTNPLAFGAPRRDGRSVLVDLATSAAAGSSIVDYMKNGTPLPPGVAIDAEGRPTTDAAKANKGALLPVGGAKGYGMALLVEILSGVLSGAGVSHQVGSMYSQFESSSNNGHAFMAIDVARFMTVDTYYDRLEALIDVIRASGQDGAVLIPGEGRWTARDRTAREGIRLDERVARGLELLADEHHVSVPWPRTTEVPEPAPVHFP